MPELKADGWAVAVRLTEELVNDPLVGQVADMALSVTVETLLPGTTDPAMLAPS